MTNERLRVIIGINIRHLRLERGLSIDELASLMGKTSGFIGLIERGERGTTARTLHLLADVFGISIDKLFYPKYEAEYENPESKEEEIERKKITSLISDFTIKELKLVTSIIKSYRETIYDADKKKNVVDDDDE